jgi:hypothetical protein
MKNVKKMIDEADDNILDELIAACESKMSSKFKPKDEPKDEEEPEVEVVAVEGDNEDDMDEEKLMKLLEMYKNSKG